MRIIDADAFCNNLRTISTRNHYEKLLCKKDQYPTVADVIEAICCDLDGTALNGFELAPTVEIPRMEIKSNGSAVIYKDKSNYIQGTIDERNHIMDILRRSNVTVCLEDNRLLTIVEYVEMKERGEL